LKFWPVLITALGWRLVIKHLGSIELLDYFADFNRSRALVKK